MEQASQHKKQDEVHEVLHPDGPGAGERNADVEESRPGIDGSRRLKGVAGEHYASLYDEAPDEDPSGPHGRNEHQERKHNDQ